MKNLLAAASLVVLTLSGCGTTNGLVSAPQSLGFQPNLRAAGHTGLAACAGEQRYGSFGTFVIVSLQGHGTSAGESTVVANLRATSDSLAKGSFKGALVLQGVTGAQLTPGTVIKAFVDYPCVVNNAIVPQATPYSVNEIQIVSSNK
jgi:hypothetical protein